MGARLPAPPLHAHRGYELGYCVPRHVARPHLPSPCDLQLAAAMRGSDLQAAYVWLNRFRGADSQRWHGDSGVAISLSDRWWTALCGRPLPAAAGGGPEYCTFFSWSPDGQTGRLPISYSGSDGVITGFELQTRWSDPEFGKHCSTWRPPAWPSHRSGGRDPSATIVVRGLL